MIKSKSTVIICILGFIFFGALGIYSILYPNSLMSILSITSGVISLALGIWQLYIGIFKKYESELPMLKVFLGIIMCALGIIFILYPNTPYLLFCIAFGIWALISGAFKIAASVQIKKEGGNIGFLLTIGTIHIIFGLMLIIFPIFTSELWFMITGAYWIYLAICFLTTIFTKEKNYLV